MAKNVTCISCSGETAPYYVHVATMTCYSCKDVSEILQVFKEHRENPDSMEYPDDLVLWAKDTFKAIEKILENGGKLNADAIELLGLISTNERCATPTVV